MIESTKYIFAKFNRPNYGPSDFLNYGSLIEDGVTSEYLDNEIDYYNKYGSKLWPAIVINN